MFPSQNDIDRLFFSDHLQKKKNGGMMLWHFGVPNLALRFSDRGFIPGGHEQALPSAFKGHPETHPGWASRMLYEGELITPNEESWLPFFRRDRWYDWGDAEPLLGGKGWSVDNPLVWEPLSIALELANRVLIALMQDRHPLWVRHSSRTIPERENANQVIQLKYHTVRLPS